MTGPRHLWSGDWELESSAHADDLAARRRPREEPDEPELPVALVASVAPVAPRRSWIRRVRERLRATRARVRMPSRRRRRVAAVVAALTLVTAGAAYAVTSALSGGSEAPGANAAALSGSGAWLGIDVESSPFGVMVVNVIPGSPAYRAGMETGDVITQINGRTIYATSDVTSAIAGEHPGDQVAIQYHGSGTSYSQHITLAARPAGYP